ncbi:hypothetical protein M8J77_026070 [Diaphorina citri]|nr:hypothetical protein M8J77_026070 [Diaphorina citri]
MERAEEDRTGNNSRDFYRTTRFFRKEYKPKAFGVKDKDGRTIIQQKEGLERWKEFFEELLNAETIEDQEEPIRYQNVQPKIDSPTLVEVTKTIQEMKNNKAPGEDGINMEMIKAGGEPVATTIYQLIKQIWHEKKIPTEWTEATVIPLHKKGDKEDCNNYRGISLLNCTYKIFSKILLKRLESYTTSIIEEHQSGFVKGRSTTDQIFIVKETIAKYWEYDRECCLLFIDFSKAYDSLYRERIWHKMESFGIPEELIKLVKLSINHSKCKVRVNGETSTSFSVRSGVRQGDGISPTLFNIAIEGALQKVKNTRGGVEIGKVINILAFADDVVIIAENLNDLKELTKVLIKETSEVGLKINETKTKFMHVKRNKEDSPSHITIDNYKFESVSSFKYLGVTLTQDHQEDIEIQARLNAANRSFHASKKLMSSKLLSRCSKIKLYKTIIRPILTYGSENWIMTKKTEKKIITFENKILRKIYGPTLENGIWRIKHNKEIRDLYNQPDIVAEVKRGRLRWMGHIIRREEESNVKSVWKNQPDGRRPRGRPKKRWWDVVKEDIEKINLTTTDATDRIKWRQGCDEAKYRLGYKWPWHFTPELNRKSTSPSSAVGGVPKIHMGFEDEFKRHLKRSGPVVSTPEFPKDMKMQTFQSEQLMMNSPSPSEFSMRLSPAVTSTPTPHVTQGTCLMESGFAPHSVIIPPSQSSSNRSSQIFKPRCHYTGTQIADNVVRGMDSSSDDVKLATNIA